MAEQWDQQGLDELNAWLMSVQPVATSTKQAGTVYDAVNTPDVNGVTPAEARFPGLDTLTMDTVQLALGLKVIGVST